MSELTTHLKELIQKPSISPNDYGCQDYIGKVLSHLGFEVQHLPFGNVSNMWARLGHESPLFVFAGHTDVVPPGDESKWRFPPFQCTTESGIIYGRGTADMKGAIAAMLAALERMKEKFQSFKGSVAFLITSDEEADAIDGTTKVVDWLVEQGIQIDYCLVGEATSEQKLGDVIKIGRRGSLSGQLTIYGKQGHIAYPHLALNPIHHAIPVIHELINTSWDSKKIEGFPPTSFQISNIHAGVGANNVIPPELIIDFNLRFSPATTANEIREKIGQILDLCSLKYAINYKHTGDPFYCPPKKFAMSLKEVIKTEYGVESYFSTSGGTSDGRFLATISKEILEFGVINRTIHQINECVHQKDLEDLSHIYEQLLTRILIEEH